MLKGTYIHTSLCYEMLLNIANHIILNYTTPFAKISTANILSLELQW